MSDVLAFERRRFDRGADIAAVAARLRPAETVGELFRLAAAEVCAGCEFDRAVVATLEGRSLGSVLTTTWAADAPSDLLARELVLRPVAVGTGTAEARLALAPARAETVRGDSVLAEALGLEHHALLAIAPEGQTVAILVADRAAGPVTAADVARLGVHAHLIGAALERIVLRTRLQNVSAELRHLTASAHALMNEALSAPVNATGERWGGTLFTETGYAPEPVKLSDTFSDREMEVAELLCAGRSNREIAAELFLAPDTVKDHVGRLVRKLDACNRVEAAVRYVALRDA